VIVDDDGAAKRIGAPVEPDCSFETFVINRSRAEVEIQTRDYAPANRANLPPPQLVAPGTNPIAYIGPHEIASSITADDVEAKLSSGSRTWLIW
jgi:hypothetical protein